MFYGCRIHQHLPHGLLSSLSSAWLWNRTEVRPRRLTVIDQQVNLAIHPRRYLSSRDGSGNGIARSR
jgi:hypothetical protein